MSKGTSKPDAAGQYDFSAVYLVQQDMKKHFRNLAVQESRFLKQLEKNHNKFFQTILQSRRQLYFGKALEESIDGQSAFGENKGGGLANRMQPQPRPKKFYTVAPTPAGSKSPDSNSTKQPKKVNTTFLVEDEHGGNEDGANYDDFDYLEVLKWEMDREKENMIGITKDQDETEAEKYIKIQEQRDKEVQQTVDLLVNNRKGLIDMAQMEFRRILLQDDILSELSKTILDSIYKNEKSRGAVIKVGEIRELLRYVDKTLFIQLLDSKSGKPGTKMTYEQFKTRAYERIQKKTGDDRYFCIDDLRGIFPRDFTEQEQKDMEQVIKIINHRASIHEVTLKDSLRPLEDWETNKKCLRSIFNIGSGVARLGKKRQSSALYFGPPPPIPNNDRPKEEEQEVHETLDITESKKKKSQHQRAHSSLPPRVNSKSLNAIEKSKQNNQEFTKRMKETLAMFLEIQNARSKKNPVVRNYGKEMEILKFMKQEAAIHGLTPPFEEPEGMCSNRKSDAQSDAEPKSLTNRSKPQSIQDIKLTYGFLRRLEEEGKNVKIGSEISDLLFLEEKDKENKERLEEKDAKKSRKPRPRDVVDFQQIKQQQIEKWYAKMYAGQQENNKANESLSLSGDGFKSGIHHDVDSATGIGSNHLDDTQRVLSNDLEGSRIIEYKAKNISNFDILSDSEKKQASNFYLKQYGIKGRPLRPKGGGFRTNSTNDSRIIENSQMSVDETAASSIHGSRILNRNITSSKLSSRRSIFGKSGNPPSYSRPSSSNENSRPISASTGIRQRFEQQVNQDNSMIIPEDFKENYANEPQKNNSLVSEKFIRFIAERGIPINNAISGEPLVFEQQQPTLIDFVNTQTNPFVRSQQGTSVIPIRPQTNTSDMNNIIDKIRPASSTGLQHGLLQYPQSRPLTGLNRMSKNIKSMGTHQSRVVAATQMTGSSFKMQLGANNIESNTDIKHLDSAANNELGIKSSKMNIADSKLSVSNYINTSQLIGFGAHNKTHSVSNTPVGVHMPPASSRFGGNSQISFKTNRQHSRMSPSKTRQEVDPFSAQPLLRNKGSIGSIATNQSRFY